MDCGTFRSVPYSLTELRSRILKSPPQTCSPLFSSEVTDSSKYKVKEGTNSSSITGAKWSPTCGMRDLEKECHNLIYWSALVTSHPSSSLR